MDCFKICVFVRRYVTRTAERKARLSVGGGAWRLPVAICEIKMLACWAPYFPAINGAPEEGRVVRSKRRVGGDVNPFLEAVVDNVFLRTRSGRGLNEVNGLKIEFRMGEESG